nr:MAG TPA: hypothetical protein [Crassvirales sp.]
MFFGTIGNLWNTLPHLSQRWLVRTGPKCKPLYHLSTRYA